MKAFGIPQEYMVSKLVSFCESIRDKGSQVITDCKKALLDKISNFLFSESSAFSRLKEKVKDFAKDTIEKGFDAVTNKISGVLGGSGGNSSGATNVLGRLIMMDYVDYLRLLLLTVTPEQKALRCADLIQVDMKTALPDNANPIKDYHTALYVKAWIDIDLWVIPGIVQKGQGGDDCCRMGPGILTCFRLKAPEEAVQNSAAGAAPPLRRQW